MLLCDCTWQALVALLCAASVRLAACVLGGACHASSLQGFMPHDLGCYTTSGGPHVLQAAPVFGGPCVAIVPRFPGQQDTERREDNCVPLYSCLRHWQGGKP